MSMAPCLPAGEESETIRSAAKKTNYRIILVIAYRTDGQSKHPKPE